MEGFQACVQVAGHSGGGKFRVEVPRRPRGHDEDGAPPGPEEDSRPFPWRGDGLCAHRGAGGAHEGRPQRDLRPARLEPNHVRCQAEVHLHLQPCRQVQQAQAAPGLVDRPRHEQGYTGEGREDQVLLPLRAGRERDGLGGHPRGGLQQRHRAHQDRQPLHQHRLGLQGLHHVHHVHQRRVQGQQDSPDKRP